MKKFYTLCLALLGAVAASAQNEDIKGMFQFADKNGTVYPDGAVITCNEVETDPFDDTKKQINSGLYVKRANDDDNYGGNLYVNITRLDNGTLQYCFPASCVTSTSTGSGKTDAQMFSDNSSLRTEWKPDGYGTCTAKFTLRVYKKVIKETSLFPGQKPMQQISYSDYLGESSSITVNFVYTDPTGINEVSDNAHATPVAYYSVDGKRLSAPQKGLNIVKMSNGKTAKIVR